MSKNFMKKKSQYSMSKNFMKKSHSIVCMSQYNVEIFMKKSHSIVCRKFYEKKVIVQYVEKNEKKSQYSMSKIL